MDRLYFLPRQAQNLIKSFSLQNVNEVRLRLGNRLFVKVNGKTVGLTYPFGQELTFADIQKSLLILTEHSIFAHENTIKQGFITTKHGLRVGICGECVFENGKIKFIKNITSLCIRLPFNAVDCSKKVFNTLCNEGVKNMLIISPPGAGKTTFLRDIIRQISYKYSQNVLVCDERYELRSGGLFELGQTVDCFAGASKSFALKTGVRALCPDVVCVDELFSAPDVCAVIEAVNCGVKVVATVHANSIETVKKKLQFQLAFKQNAFEVFVELFGVGQVKNFGVINNV